MESGTRLGPYEILKQLGAGGMGEVYLATDPRLGRNVAVKVLPEEFAGDPERLARFEQEARAAAALSHTNIAAVFDVGAEAGVHYFLQEFLSGEELREQIDRQPPDTASAVEIGLQIARALEAAHRAGVVHRDLKPENVFVTDDRVVKVLDFGLAKLVEAQGSSSQIAADSPTQLGTSAGVIMGTAGYMAPEQVQGGDIDGRSDVFAFGCLLYEMLAHSRPFRGDSVIQTLNRIVHEEPRPLSELVAVPSELQRIVGKCLAKQPRRRYQSVADLVVDLEAFAAEPGDKAGPLPEPAQSEAAGRFRVGAPFAAVLTLLALVAGAIAGGLIGTEPPVAARAVRSDLMISIEPRNDPVTAVSPDGAAIAYLGASGIEASGLYIRVLGTGQARLLPDTEQAHTPFFSPDGASLGYFDDNDRSLWSVSLATGNRRRLAPTASAHLGAAWTSAGTLVFAHFEGGLGVVSETGGDVRLLAAPEDENLSYENPRPIPGSGDVFVTIRNTATDIETLSVGVVDGVSGETRVVLEVGSDARYVEPGYLLFRARNSIAAVPFDLGRREATGDPFTVIDGVAVTSDGPLEYDVSPNGVLMYLTAADYPRRDRFSVVAVDRSGNATSLPMPEGGYSGIRVSPSGDRLAVDVGSATFVRPETVIVDLTSGSRAVVGEQQWFPAWSRDGDWLAVTRMQDDGSFLLVLVATDLSGAERVLGGPQPAWTPQPVAFMPGDESLVVTSMTRDTVWMIDASDAAAPQQITMPLSPSGTALSPDGRWLAFSTEDGAEQRLQVVERATGRRWSAVSGIYPRWARDGRALYYWSDDTLFMLPVQSDADGWSAGEPRPVFSGEYEIGVGERASWDLSPDGETFYLIRDDGPPGWGDARLDLVQNAGMIVADADPARR